jgi:chemotaxis response regulator CheB
MTRNVRVLVANQPRLMRELLLETISDQPDIEVVGEVQNEADILLAVEQNRPDFLIVALDNHRSRPPVCALLLEKFPNMKILALAPERNLTVFYWASIDIHSLDLEASEEGILEVLRGPGRRAGGYQ